MHIPGMSGRMHGWHYIMVKTYITLFKLKIKKLFSTGFFHIFGSNVVNKIIGFLSGVLMVRIVSKAEFGSYSYTLNLVSIAEVFSALGMVSGVFQLCSEKLEDKQSQDRLYKYGSSFGLCVNIVISCVLLIISYCIRLPIGGANILLRSCSFIPFFFVLPEFQLIRLRSQLKTIQYSYSNTINCACIAAFTVVGGVLCDAKGALIGRMLSYILTFALIFILFRTPVYLKPIKMESSDKKDLFSVSIVSMVNTGLSQLLYLIDVFIIGIVLTSDELVATYKVATTIPTALTFIPSSIIIFIYPYFASHKDEPDWIWSSYKKMTGALVIFNIILVSLLFLFAPWLITFIFGSIYADSVPAFRLLLINYFLTSSLKMMLGNIMVMMRRLRYNLFETLMSSGINIIGDYILIKAVSIEGAAYSTLLVTSTASIVSFFYFRYTLNKLKNEQSL